MTLAQYEAVCLGSSSGAGAASKENGTNAGGSDAACVSHSSPATVSPLNTANKNQRSKQQLTLTEGGAGGPSAGVSGTKAHKNQKTKQRLTLTEGGEGGPSVGVSGAKRIKTNQSPASDPAVEYEVAPPRVK